MLKKIAALVICLTLVLTVPACTNYHRDGAVNGAVIGGLYGGVVGAMLDHRNPWRGGVIGAALGAMAGATITDVSARGVNEAYLSGMPVEYRTVNNRARYSAEPLEFDPLTRCRWVSEKVWEGNALVIDRTREVCTEE